MEKIPYDQFIDTLASARLKVTPGTHWRHYQGSEYIIKDIVLLEATIEVAVVYMPVGQPEIAFVRPLTSWFERVTAPGQSVPRFSKVVETASVTPVV